MSPPRFAIAGDANVGGAQALARLRRLEPVFGLIQTIPNPTLTELAVWSGFDFVILDGEHGIADEPAHLACLQVVAGTDAFAAVRVPAGNFGAVGRYLDLGADAILMPDVRSGADAAAFVAAATTGPTGTRSSTGSARTSRYGLGRLSDQPPLLLAMIEGQKAVERIAAIIATPGIDGLVIGPSDLSADLGRPNDFANAAYAQAFRHVERSAADARLVFGTKPHPGFELWRLLAAGHRFIIAAADVTTLRDGYRAQLAAAHAALAGETK
jgi:2-keto-3-deoxy-L-rhamnonate aldolase RhmA